jgi:hypothetical protein
MRRQSKSHHHLTKETERDQSARGLWGRLIHEPINLFTAALAIVAVIQAWAFIASERAFVSVASLDLSRISNSPDQPFQISSDGGGLWSKHCDSYRLQRYADDQSS